MHDLLSHALYFDPLRHCHLLQKRRLLATVSIFHWHSMQAERGYKQGLLMYPKSPPLLRSYAQFMQDIKLNPHASMRYYVEADKLDAQQQEVLRISPDRLSSMASAWPESNS